MGNSQVSSSSSVPFASFLPSPLPVSSIGSYENQQQEEKSGGIEPVLEQDYAPVRTSTPRIPTPPMSMPPTPPSTSLPPVPPTPPVPPSGASAPEESPDEAFLRRTQEFIEQHRDRLNITRAWSIIVRVCSPREMPQHEASMQWDAELFFACLSIRRDVPPSLHKRLVIHELLELLTCESLELFLELIREIGTLLDERLIASFKRRYYAARNRHIEAILTEYLGEPRAAHLFLEKRPAESMVVPVAPKEEGYVAPARPIISKAEVEDWLNTTFGTPDDQLFGDETTCMPSASLPAVAEDPYVPTYTTKWLAKIAKKHLVPFLPALVGSQVFATEEMDLAAPKTGEHAAYSPESEERDAIAELSPRSVFSNLPTIRLDLLLFQRLAEPITNPEPIIGRLGGTAESVSIGGVPPVPVEESPVLPPMLFLATPLPSLPRVSGEKSAWEKLMELQNLPDEVQGEMSPAL